MITEEPPHGLTGQEAGSALSLVAGPRFALHHWWHCLLRDEVAVSLSSSCMPKVES